MQSNIPCNRRLSTIQKENVLISFFLRKIYGIRVSWLNYKIGYVPFIKSWKNLQRPKVVISLINKKKNAFEKCTWKLLWKPHHNVILSSEFLIFLKNDDIHWGLHFFLFWTKWQFPLSIQNVFWKQCEGYLFKHLKKKESSVKNSTEIFKLN